MKKNSLVFILFLLIGMLAGMIVAELLSPFPFLSFLTRSAEITWEPKANLNIIQYDFYIRVKLNLASILGLVMSIWIYRKL